MRQVVSDVFIMQGLRSANVYVLRSDDGLTMVDTGWALDAGRIVSQLTEAGYALSDLRSIVLTHWHGDHTGNAADLARRSGAQVLAHRAEAPYIERSKSAPTASPVQRLLNWMSDHVLLPRSPCRVDRPLEDGETIDALGPMRAIHAPGHTPGSLCLYHPERQILFCGDVLFNVHPLTGRKGLGLHMRLLALDKAQARHSARNLSTLPIQVLCPGHGEPILERAHEQMRALLSDGKR